MHQAASPYHHGNLRLELLWRAERQLEANGVAGLSLRELARQAGVSHAAPRQHFPDKRALLDALAVSGLSRLISALETATRQCPESFAERLTAFTRVYVTFAVRHPALLTLLLERMKHPGSTALRESFARVSTALYALVEEAVAAGDIIPDDPDLVALGLMTTLQGLAVMSASDMIDARAVERVVNGTIRTLSKG